MDLGLAGHELGEDAAEALGLRAQRRPDPVVARRRRVALVEHEVDDLEDRRQTRRTLAAARRLERDVRLRERALGADDPLGDGRLRREERAGDLRRGEAAEQAQGQRDACLARQDRVAGHEDQPQHVVLDAVVEHRLEVGLLGLLELAAELLVLALQPRVAAEQVDRTVLGGGHEPGARVVRDARLGPLLQRRHERVLREVLGQPDVAHLPRQAGDEPRRLDPPDRLDRGLRAGAHRPVATGGRRAARAGDPRPRAAPA